MCQISPYHAGASHCAYIVSDQVGQAIPKSLTVLSAYRSLGVLARRDALATHEGTDCFAPGRECAGRPASIE